MPSAKFTQAAADSRKLKAKPSNEELLEVSLGDFFTLGAQGTAEREGGDPELDGD